jgi:cation diffusion facilitator family transporter
MNPEAQHPAHRGIRAVQYGMGLNLLLMVVKGVAGVAGHSYALVADAIESASDVFSSLVVWIGLRTAARPPDRNHPYGHGKAEPVAGVIVSIMLALAAVFIGYQSFLNITTPHEVPKSWTLWVLGAIILGKEMIFRYVVRTAEDINSTAVKGEAQHHRSDAVTSLTAFAGIAIALIGGKGYESADDWAALFAGVFIAWNAWKIFRPSFSELMDEAQPEEVVFEIQRLAEEVQGVANIEKCFVRKMGFELFVDIHLRVDPDITVKEGHDIAHAVKDAIRARRPEVYDVLTHVEPAQTSMQVNN